MQPSGCLSVSSRDTFFVSHARTCVKQQALPSGTLPQNMRIIVQPTRMTYMYLPVASRLGARRKRPFCSLREDSDFFVPTPNLGVYVAATGVDFAAHTLQDVAVSLLLLWLPCPTIDRPCCRWYFFSRIEYTTAVFSNDMQCARADRPQ